MGGNLSLSNAFLRSAAGFAPHLGRHAARFCAPKFRKLQMRERMPLPRNVSPLAEQKMIREYLGQAARLRGFASSVTPPRPKARLLGEAANQERLAQKGTQHSFAI